VQGDRYGRLALSDSGLRRRERYVLETCRKAALPVAVSIAGGFAATPERTAELHAMVFEEAACLVRAGRDAVPFRTPEYRVTHPTSGTDT
jgi:acetoin utilization deacetylase AcuC-like enzyme